MLQDKDNDSENKKKYSRRAFLKKTAVIGGSILLSSTFLKYCEDTSTNDSVNHENGNDGRTEPTLYDIPEEDASLLNYPGENLIVTRIDGKVYALSNICTHAGCDIEYNKGLSHFKCPCHYSEFQLDGSYIKGQAGRGLDRYKIKLKGKAKLEIDTSRIYKETDEVYKELFIEL
ncbi:MAG: ubiquinol-cytochrome c reductase iron-sulfur subunit [Spirochaetota bacterium]